MAENHPLDQFRKSRGLSLEALGQTLGVDKGHLSRIIRGLAWPSRDFFERVATLTNGEVTANDFVTPLPASPASTQEAQP